MIVKRLLRMFLVHSFILMMGIFLVQPASAQQVEGVVTDAQTGENLPGVNVIVKGTTIGTATGTDGSYTIDVNSLQEDTLTFSFVGYQNQEVPIDGRTTINMELNTESYRRGDGCCRIRHPVGSKFNGFGIRG